MTEALFLPLAVGTGVVVIVVALAVVALAVIVAATMRGRDQSRGAARRDLDEVHERAGKADRERQAPQQTKPRD